VSALTDLSNNTTTLTINYPVANSSAFLFASQAKTQVRMDRWMGKHMHGCACMGVCEGNNGITQR
jgi:hypothetical protein